MKKVKLFLSFVMMCLCIAVLCIGILASSSANYDLGGKITYNVVDGVALINTRVYKVAGQTTESNLSSKCSTLSTMHFENIERSTNPYYVLSQEFSSQGAINKSNIDTVTKDINIIYGATNTSLEYYTYYVVVSIKNLSTDTNKSIIATLNTEIANTNTSYIKSSTTQIMLRNGTFKNIVIGFSSINTTIVETSESFNYSITLEYDEFLFDSGSYRYIEMGTYSSTAIRWSLVGFQTDMDDLTTFTAYTYNASEKLTLDSLKGKGAIFLQQTHSGSTAFLGTNGGSASYYTSDIREKIRDGTFYNLTNNEKSLITKRNITEISHGSMTFSGTTDDYFWLLSVNEVNKYLTSKVWYPHNYSSTTYGRNWWLRDPRSGATTWAMEVDDDGDVTFTQIEWSMYIRAAFILK